MRTEEKRVIHLEAAGVVVVRKAGVLARSARGKGSLVRDVHLFRDWVWEDALDRELPTSSLEVSAARSRPRRARNLPMAAGEGRRAATCTRRGT